MSNSDPQTPVRATEPVHSLGTALGDAGALVVRPIVFMQPDRAVYPPAWLEHIPFAFWLVDVVKPRVFVELGTHSGNSYGAFAQAVQHLGLDAAGYCIDTWRGDAQAGFYDESVFADWKAYHDEHYSAFSTVVRSTFDDALAHFADGAIDLLNIDGFHTTEAVLHDFRTWLPKMSARGVVLMHDINVREGDFGAWRAWEQIRSEYSSFAFLHGHGLGLVAVGTDLPAEIATLIEPETAASGRSVVVRQVFAGAGAAILARYTATTQARQSEALAASARTAYDSGVNALRTEIERLTALVTAAATDKGRAEERSAWLQEEIDRRGQRLEEIESTKRELEGSRAELERIVRDTEARLETADRQVEEATRRAEALDTHRRALEAERAALEAERTAHRNGLREWEQHATALEADRNRLRRELAESHELSAARSEEMRALAEDVRALRGELGMMRSSTSWRVTAALRGTRRVIDKLRRQIGN